MLSVNDMLEILKNNSSMAIPISIFISIMISLLGVLPSVFVTGANILFFGTVEGFFISLLGETIGAYVTFALYRFGFKRRIGKLSDKYKLISQIAKSNGKKAGLLIFQGRLIPFIPSGVITLAASISSVSGGMFIITTLIGKIPSIAIEVLVSYDVINIYNNWLRLIMTITGLMLMLITLRGRNYK